MWWLVSCAAASTGSINEIEISSDGTEARVSSRIGMLYAAESTLRRCTFRGVHPGDNCCDLEPLLGLSVCEGPVCDSDNAPPRDVLLVAKIGWASRRSCP